MNTSKNKRPRVVVIGGGFAGLNVVKKLRNAPVEIVLIDRRNYHLFQPLLYQVATAELDPSNIATPIRQILKKQKNVEVALGEVTGVDFERQRIMFDGGETPYDYLVIATGVQPGYFGHDEFRPHAPGLKDIDDALEIRRRVLLAFEEAEWEADDEARRAKLTFVVVGGGPTGIELAGAIKDVASEVLPTQFQHIKREHSRVILVQGADRLVPAMPADLSERAQKVLERMGVEIRLNSRVTGVDTLGVVIGTERVKAANVFWAAGVQGQKLAQQLNVPLDHGGRLIVGPDLAIAGRENVFVIGDAASATDANTNKPVPGLAQAALQMGKFVAQIIENEQNGKSAAKRPAFGYRDKGSMAMIGRGNAIAAIGHTHFGGLAGWLVWNFIHVMFLIGFGNKLVVMADWLKNLVWRRRHCCLITAHPRMHIKKLK